MPKASLQTLGCKVNQYETQAIQKSLEAAGFEIALPGETADFVLINTCSVTSDAEAKSRAAVRKAKRQNPDAYVMATGCAAQMALNQERVMEGADFTLLNPEKLKALDHLKQLNPGLVNLALAERSEELAPRRRARAALKVQDGCSLGCSYCSIPSTRPGLVSRPWKEVLAEAQELAESGCHEAVLTGVLVGSYGPESGSEGPDLPGLIRLLSQESGLARLRLSSIEPQQVGAELIALVEEGALVPHLHIPLQSGSVGVLRDMDRRYNPAEYLAVMERLRERVPGISISTDIMVGFPTEGDAEFEETLETSRQADFIKAHVFRFSPRWGTDADPLGDPVHPETKKVRAQTLSQLVESGAAKLAQNKVGQTLRLILEMKKDRDGYWEGLSDCGFSVKVEGPDGLGGSLVWAEVSESSGVTLSGRLTSAPR